jgi:hypothetical protein
MVEPKDSGQLKSKLGRGGVIRRAVCDLSITVLTPSKEASPLLWRRLGFYSALFFSRNGVFAVAALS